jgi:hypothetical protein
MRHVSAHLGAALALFTTLAGLSAPAVAVPSFAVQTGQPCQACHVGGFGPQLTMFGREFKIGGYTSRAGKFNVPLSAMVVASYVATKNDQSEPPAPNFHTNNNLALDQISGFLAGGIGNHVGGFVQVTYDGVGKAWAWDNLDLRAVTPTQIGSTPMVIGASLNNSPGVQDPWNTLSAWGFPYTASGIVPSPAVAPLMVGGLAQETMGLTAYAWINSSIYLEAGGYSTPSVSVLNWLGADPYSPGNIHGVAPYGRVAWQKMVGTGNVEIGAFGLRASLYPDRDQTSGMSDRYTDLGVDASWQMPRDNGDMFTVNARYMHESQVLNASHALGNTSNVDNTLNDWRLDASYYWRNAIGATLGFFDTNGSADPIRYGTENGKPDSTGILMQIDGTPFGNGSPVGSWFNVRMGVQYTVYTRFDGTHDGASGNDTLRIFTWLAF